MPFVLGFALNAVLPSNAEKLFAEKKFDAAQKIYKQRLVKNADNAVLHYNLGCVDGNLKQHDAAAEHFGKALKSTPEVQFRAYNNLGYTYYRMGQQYLNDKNKTPTIQLWEKSLSFYQNALELNPKSERTRHDYEWVKKELEKLKQQQQTDPQASQQPKNNHQQKKDKDADNKPQQEQQHDGGQKSQTERPSADDTMTKEEAERLLDLAKNGEKALPSQQQKTPTSTTRNARKDW